MNNLNDFADYLEGLSERMANDLKTRALLPAAVEGAAIVSQRISSGEASDGSKIGDYSKDKIYVGLASFKGFESKFRPKQGKKTMKFEQGYSEFRSFIGRQNNYVDLSLSGSMHKSFRGVLYGADAIIALFGQDSIDKAEGNEKRFKKDILRPSADDIEIIKNVMTNQIMLLFKRANIKR